MVSLWVDLLGSSISYYGVQGIKTRCLEAGQGENLILLHGAGAHAEIWMKNLVPLSESFHVYALDMLGHGLTDAPDVKYEVRDFVNHLKDFMDVEGIKTAYLIGNSLGGWVASWFAIEHPERVGKVVLDVGASLKPTGESYGDIDALARVVKMELEALENPSPGSFETVHRQFVHRPDQVEHEVRELSEVTYRVYSRPETRKAAFKIFSQLTFSDVESKRPGLSRQKYALTRERLKSLKVPTYFLWTDHNTTMPATVAEMAHRVTQGSKLDVIKNCGHWPHLERPDEFNKLVAKFLI